MYKAAISVLLFLLISACAPVTYRTGTVCVKPFDSTGYSTSDPVEVQSETVNHAIGAIKTAIEIEIGNESKLTVSENCSTADYILQGRLVRIGVIGQRLLHGKSERRFSFEASGNLLDTKKGLPVAYFNESTGEDEYEYSVNDLAEDIVKEIRAVPIK